MAEDYQDFIRHLDLYNKNLLSYQNMPWKKIPGSKQEIDLRRQDVLNGQRWGYRRWYSLFGYDF